MRRAAIALGVLALLIGACAGYFRYSMNQRMRGTSVPPEQMFQVLIATPVPEAVGELQGAGTTWQGYAIYLRFRAPSLDAAGFRSPPYETVACTEIASRFAFPEHMDSPFSPPWSPSLSPNATCLQRYELSNEWTHLGSHFAVYSDGWLHFTGSGG